MSNDHVGFDTKEQKADQLEALKIEHENHVRFGRLERAKQVAAYAKEHHGATLSTPRKAAED